MSYAYEQLFRHGFLHIDPERAHSLGAAAIRAVGIARPGVRAPASLRTSAFDRAFPTPFGLAAGFDKDATMIAGLGALGFGHIEVGTLTALPQPGNARPRLFRLPDDRALINRMGFNNGGAAAAADRIAEAREARSGPVIGVNIGKSRAVEATDAAAVVRDYQTATRLLSPVADYLAVNVSSPNTPGLRDLQDPAALVPLMAAILDTANGVPVLVKIAPDLDARAIDDMAALAQSEGLAGVIATNTTVERTGLRSPAEQVSDAGAGGLSGAPLAPRSLEVLRQLRSNLPAESTVVSVGGVETAAHVAERLAAGANLVQGYTGFIYNGPGWARDINRGLASLADSPRP